MTCAQCGRAISAGVAYCQHCGVGQWARTGAARRARLLRRSAIDRQLTGVCGGIAGYFSIDPVIMRVAWVVLTIIPGWFLLMVLAYVVASLIIPAASPGSEPSATDSAYDRWQRTRRLNRSATNAKIAGVCGGIAEYFSVDPTIIRVVWVLLSIFPGAIISGVVVYLVAWFIMPTGSVPVTTSPVPSLGSTSE